MDYTWEDVNGLYSKGLINAKDRSSLRAQLLGEQNQIEGLTTRFVNNLKEDYSRNFADLIVALKQTGKEITSGPAAKGGKKETYGFFSLPPPAQAALQALSLLTFAPVMTAAGRAAGTEYQDVLLKWGVDSEIVAMTAAFLDAGTQMRSAQAVAKITGVMPSMKQIKELLKKDSTALKNFADKIPQSVVAEAQKIVEKQNPKNLVDIIRPGQDTPLPNKSGVMVTPRKLLPPPAQQADEAAITALKNQADTHDLLAKAQATLQPALRSETAKTLDAAMATITGRSTPEQLLNRTAAKQIEDSSAALLQRMKLSKAPRGGAPGYDDYLAAIKKSGIAYDENKALLDAGKINIDDAIEQASWLGITKDDIAKITPGQPVDPHVILSNALAMKPAQREVYQAFVTADKELAKGNIQPFWSAMAQFHALREIDPNFRMPLQTAGQTLRVAGKPAVNVTRYQDKIVENGSWLAGEDLKTIDEIQANAPAIIRRMLAMGDPDKVALAASGINTLSEQVVKDPTFRDKARFLFVNNIMSGTDTIGRNVFGNVIAAPWHYAEKATGGMAAKVLNPFLSAEHHIEAGYVGEANTFITTWARSMWDAARYTMRGNRAALESMVPANARADLFRNRYEMPIFSTTGTTNPLGAGPIAKSLAYPTTFAQLADEVARVAIYRGMVSERLKHEWLVTKSPLSWGQFEFKGFQNIAPDIHDYAIRQAGLMTYTDDMSAFGKILNFARAKLPGTEFTQPFVHTFDRLMAYQWNRSPGLSLISSKTLEELRSGDPLIRQEMVGRLFLSNILGTGLFLIARSKAPDGESFITGGGPTNRALASNLRESGTIHPYTMWTPLGRMPYKLFSPLAGPLGLVADTAEIIDQMKDPQATDLFSGIVLAGSRTFFDNTYSGLFGLVTSIADNPTGDGFERYARTTLINTAKGMVPFSSLIRQGLRIYDPTVKDVREDASIQDPFTRELYRSWWEMTREIPGYGAPAKINPRTGKPVLNPPRVFDGTPAGWFLPTAPIQVEDDAIRKKFLELKMPYPRFPKSYGGGVPSNSPFAYSGALGPAKEAAGGIPYSLEQQNKGAQYIHQADDFGVTLNQELQTMMADPEFHKQAPIVQQEQIYNAYNRRIHAAEGKIHQEYPELDEQLSARRQLRGELRMNPDELQGYRMEEQAQPEPIREPETLDFGNPYDSEVSTQSGENP